MRTQFRPWLIALALHMVGGVAVSIGVAWIVSRADWSSFAPGRKAPTPPHISPEGVLFRADQVAVGCWQGIARAASEVSEASRKRYTVKALPEWLARPNARAERVTVVTYAMGWPLPAMRTTLVPNSSSGSGDTTLQSRIATGKQRPALSEIIVPGMLVNALLYGAALGLFWVTIRWVYRRRHREPWQCRKCRYDLRGLPPDTPCPECGRAPTTSSSSEPPPSTTQNPLQSPRASQGRAP